MIKVLELLLCNISNNYIHVRRNICQINNFSNFLVPIYNENGDKLEWFIGPLIESKESSTCPSGFEFKDSLCHGILE